MCCKSWDFAGRQRYLNSRERQRLGRIKFNYFRKIENEVANIVSFLPSSYNRSKRKILRDTRQHVEWLEMLK